ncbi:flagellar brake protein [Pseudodesulfovibrio sp. JC047]|uniref:flagellar brake protein n=1 Tax=Pseudodesulfovibrio sp. JC047 TaxID=2683199 RepID=UPI0013D67C22|nr:flagellar brake protein [Pseudodesulfovibrio sp. JC047]NDV19662.1 flagellar brake protein [Pseudodesulfovibrio sp. JC047]
MPPKPHTTKPEICTLNDTKVALIPGVKMQISLGKKVIIRIPGTKQSYRGKIVGYEPYDYVIANVRLPSRIRHELALGGEIILKYIHKGTVYGFKTTVHNAIVSPTSLLFFDYPSVIEKIELRRKERTHCNIDGTLHTSNATYDCFIVNVSETGCKISARAGSRDQLSKARVDDTLFVIMNLGSNGILKLPILIRNVHKDHGIITMGTMFLDIQKEEKEHINAYLARVQRHTR